MMGDLEAFLGDEKASSWGWVSADQSLRCRRRCRLHHWCHCIPTQGRRTEYEGHVHCLGKCQAVWLSRLPTGVRALTLSTRSCMTAVVSFLYSEISVLSWRFDLLAASS